VSWKAAVSQIRRERAAGKTGPLVLVGHSQGANNVIDMARLLEADKVPVDLLVTLDPLLQNPIPTNVVRAINYYQASGWGGPIIPDPGFHGKLSNVDIGEDLSISHLSIDKSARIHADIARAIAALSQPEKTGKAPADESRDRAGGDSRVRR
jgi:thioesterase domain-containing protein